MPTTEADEQSALKALEEDRPTLASAVTSLPWVADGTEERQALRALVNLETLYGTDMSPALANKTWLSDGVDERDVLILTWLGDFVSYGEAEAGRLVRMPFLDSLDEVATDTLQALDELGKPVNRRWLYSAVLAEPWVEDGLDQPEIAVIEVLQGLGLGALSSALLDKPWVEDGVKEFEVAIVSELGELAGTAEGAAITILGLPFLETPDPLDFDGVVALGRLAAAPEVLGALLEREWVGDGLDEPEAQVTDRLRRIAQWDDDIALRIVATPFLRTLEPVDVAAVETLWSLGGNSRQALRAVVEKTWVEDGLDESETTFVEELGRWANRAAVAAVQIAEKLEAPDTNALEPLAALAYRHHDLLRATMERPWAQDGLDEDEAEIVKYLNWTALGGQDVALWLAAFVHTVDADEVDSMAALWALGAWSQDALRAVLAKSWAQDGIDEAETVVVRNIGWLANRNEGGALQVLEMPFLQTIGPADADAVVALQILGSRSHDGLVAVMGLPWVEDGLDEDEAEFVGALGWFAEQDEESALRLLGSFSTKPPRAADAAAVSVLRRLAANHPELFHAVLAKPWVEDGLDEPETAIAQQLSWLAGRDEPAALKVLAMPFLQSIEPADGAAVAALRHMGSFKPENFQRVMAHPSVSGGVSDEWAKVVTVVAASSDLDPDLIDVLLDPRRVSVEERTIRLPLAGEVTMAIVRTRPGAEGVMMDYLEHSLRSSEAFMGAPLPTSHVTLHFDEVYGALGAGVHFGTHIGMLSRYDVDDGSAVARDAAPIIAHEVGHYYWRAGKPWVVEGGASFLEAVSEHERTGQSIDAGGHPCTHAGDIAQLEGQGAEGEFGCYYAFGERLLLDLYRNLGEATFRRGFLDLYYRTRAGPVEIDDYRAAFTAVAPDRAADIDQIAARWYEGAETPGAFVADESPVDPKLPGFSGRIADAYITTIGGLRLVGFSTRHIYDIWLEMRFIVNPEDERRELRLSIEGYFEDGFAFWLREMTVPVLAGQTSGNIEVFRGAAPTYQWAPGRYVVYVYSEGQKVAEVQFEVVP